MSDSQNDSMHTCNVSRNYKNDLGIERFTWSKIMADRNIDELTKLEGFQELLKEFEMLVKRDTERLVLKYNLSKEEIGTLMTNELERCFAKYQAKSKKA